MNFSNNIEQFIQPETITSQQLTYNLTEIQKRSKMATNSTNDRDDRPIMENMLQRDHAINQNKEESGLKFSFVVLFFFIPTVFWNL
jgi:hypothetical protein